MKSLQVILRKVLEVLFIIFLALGLQLPAAFAQSRAPTVLYVSPSGNGADGLTEQTAFRKIDDAIYRTIPGDTVLVMNGTYTTPDYKDVIAYISNSGRPDAWITYKAYPGHRPKLKSKNVTAVRFVGASYIIFDGFDIEGSRNEITKAQADAVLCDGISSSEVTAKAQGEGLYLVADYENINRISHHIIIRNNRIYGFGANGISAEGTDYVTIENNTVYDNALFSPYDTSGITVYQSRDLEPIPDGQEGKIVKTVVRGNTSFGNRNEFGFVVGFGDNKCDRTADITDGNGIIIDDSRNTQGSRIGKKPYRGRTLVENNIVYGNGGRGINIFSSNHVDVVNNTSYLNAQTNVRAIDSEFASDEVTDVRVMNNIFYVQSGRLANSVVSLVNDKKGERSTIRYDNNLIFGSTEFDPVSGANNLVGSNPQFANESAKDFMLKEQSPAIDRGVASLSGLNAPGADARGTKRPQGNGIDIGALELAALQRSTQRMLRNGDIASKKRIR